MAFLKLGRLCLLLLMFMTVATQTASGFKRKKREWILPPTKLKENVDYTKQEFIAKIKSDKDTEEKQFEYSLRGPGADKEPFNLFVINPKNGFVRITGILDREKVASYTMTGIAKYKDGRLAEEEIQLKIQVVDENDNPPQFKLFKGSVPECSKIGTSVMQIAADDADEQGTLNSRIAYSILKQIPEDSGPMFTIDRITGEIFVKEHTLDREVYDSYTLIVQGVDMDGASHGNTGTGTVEVKVLDINDNIPTLEKDEYAGTIDEGAADVVVMRIKSVDKDLKNTDNWLTIFDIINGNEDELFTIETDSKMNEGILKLVKPVDYEKVKELDLDLAISNVSPFINGSALSLGKSLNLDKLEEAGIIAGAGVEAGKGLGAGMGGNTGGDVGVGTGGDVGVGAGAGVGINSGAKPDIHPGMKPVGGPSSKPGIKPGSKPGKTTPKGGKSYPIKIRVNNLSEGPCFSPSLKELPVSENPEEIDVPMIIGSFPAMDLDTGKIAENVRYAKVFDPDNWVSINEETSEMKLMKVPDRESKSLVNGSYIVKIICMTQDVPPKTATGTIALKVHDSNDHCPTLTSTYQSICADSKVVYVTAFDEDDYPNGKPYKFVLIEEETQGKWEMFDENETTVSIHAKEPLWTGLYELTLEIYDQQDLECEDKQKLKLQVCTCEHGGKCDTQLAYQHGSSAKMGFPAITVLLAALILLMLIPLLLLSCKCKTVKFFEMPFETKECLVLYNTEGKGKDMSLLPFVVAERNPVTAVGNTLNKADIIQHAKGLDSKTINTSRKSGYQDNTVHGTCRNYHEWHVMALPDDVLRKYFSENAKLLADNPDSNDSTMEYKNEGQYFTDGSLDRYSFLEDDNDLIFLNDLDTKFVNLATVCSPPPSKLEQVEKTAKSLDARIKTEGSNTTSADQVVKSDQPPPQQSTISNVTESQQIKQSGSINTSPPVLIQQQPLYCLVEHQSPSTVQELYLINGLEGTPGLVLQGGNTLQYSGKEQGVYLIDGMPMVQRHIMLANSPTLVSGGSLAVSSLLVQEENDKQRLQVSLPEDAQLRELKDKPDVKVKVKYTEPAKFKDEKINEHMMNEKND